MILLFICKSLLSLSL